MEMRLPTIVALNMMDVAQDRGISINAELLRERLGCPVIAMNAAKEEGIKPLLDTVGEQVKNISRSPSYVAYPAVIEDALAELVPYIH